ncbi:DUF6771 family protein [uncultured Sphingopyxis sp.]|uniref:DUF6771 family protein n=1 Tax=uncultured Sphingopyxis sp. TaxID=310581 RepID=UPI0025F4DF69|nr:DUF6771 family protein [uncultured Sphingopyxis sp.]
MKHKDLSRVAETILAAPGWARVGITAPVNHLRVAAAHELARAILEDAEQTSKHSTGDQLGLSL